MFELVLLGVLAFVVYKVAHRNALSSAQVAAGTIAASMAAGQQYAFQVQSPLDANTIASELAGVGAQVLGIVIPVGPNLWEGVFVWGGVDGEPTENLPNVTWLSLEPYGNAALPAPGAIG